MYNDYDSDVFRTLYFALGLVVPKFSSFQVLGLRRGVWKCKAALICRGVNNESRIFWGVCFAIALLRTIRCVFANVGCMPSELQAAMSLSPLQLQHLESLSSAVGAKCGFGV